MYQQFLIAVCPEDASWLYFDPGLSTQTTNGDGIPATPHVSKSLSSFLPSSSHTLSWPSNSAELN